LGARLVRVFAAAEFHQRAKEEHEARGANPEPRDNQ
jgi:hypothetical protein